MAEIRFEEVCKRFKSAAVISGLDLVIRDGEFFTFVGPSGCGKSTVLNMIAGLEPVSGGNIYFDNVVVNDLTPGERDIAMVFQSYALYPHMTVYENIAFPLRMRKVRKHEMDREVRRVAGLLGLGDLLRRRPKELSGGQRQRVALGRAIIRKPRVFLMDEPLSNLDARLRIEMRAELKKLHRELGITTVYVTHDQEEAMSLSERIAVLLRGEIQQCGTPYDVYSRPANTFVGGFIGSPPMNFIDATVTDIPPAGIDINGFIVASPADIPRDKKRVKIGIRPEDITVTGEKTADCTEAGVNLVEPAGSFVRVDLLWNSLMIKGIAKADGGIKAGDKVYFTMPLEKMMLFDADSGNLL
jgi:multiple sugar transport system ATP-binding protein